MNITTHRRGRTGALAAGVVGAVVLTMLGATGGAIAGARIGSRQIADNSIRSRDVHDGGLRLRDLDPGTQAALAGPPGQDGEPGVDGVAQVVPFVGPVASILPNSGSYVFAGASAQVTTTAIHSRVTGSVSASLGLNTGSPQFADVGMCHQPSAGGATTNFVGSSFATNPFSTVRATYVVAATVALPPGTYKVGMCIRNNGSSTINNNNYASGWVMVTS